MPTKTPTIDTKAIAKAFERWQESNSYPLVEGAQANWLSEAFKRGYIAGMAAKGKR